MKSEKNMKSLLLILITSLSIFACSNDDSVPALLKVEGVVQSTVSCNTENNGLAISIELSEPLDSGIEMIITANLPNEFKEEGTELRFDMEPSQNGFTNCVAVYSSNIMFKVYNVQLITKSETP